jgi:hypothetical protein
MSKPGYDPELAVRAAELWNRIVCWEGEDADGALILERALHEETVRLRADLTALKAELALVSARCRELEALVERLKRDATVRKNLDKIAEKNRERALTAPASGGEKVSQ